MFLAPDRQALRARDRRRAFAVRSYTGRNGQGKSATAIFDLLPCLEAGKPCLSTVRLLDYKDPRPCDKSVFDCDDPDGHMQPGGHMAAHPLYIPLRDWPQLLEFSGGPVFFDEITGIADSSEQNALPQQVRELFQQLRRKEVTVSWTGLSFIRGHKTIREPTQCVVRCTSLLPKATYGPDGKERMWRQRRLVVARAYHADSLPIDDHTDRAFENADRIGVGRWWIPGSEASMAYDTYAPVLRVGKITEGGRCATCAGVRRAPECSCADYQERKAESRPRRTARTRASAEDGAPGRGSDSVPVSPTTSHTSTLPVVSGCGNHASACSCVA